MHSNAVQQNLPPLIQALCRPEVWPHPVDTVRVIETHISWVLLTGRYAYKIKRPLNLPFLDFSTLEQRKAACQEELRLNQRLAPALYQSVVAITGNESQPVIVSDDVTEATVLEYAVKMREFPQDQQLDRQLQEAGLEFRDMDDLAVAISGMHTQAPVAKPDDQWGTVESIATPAIENFATLEPLIDDTADQLTLQRLREWTDTQITLLTPRMEQRRRDGFIRECHGDLHLSNLTRFEGNILAFDCIEFDAKLRWRDVMSELGFVVMDLAARQRIDLAWRLLNRYLELTGDYSGAVTLRFYLVYASMVRAKIAALRAEQESPRSVVYADAARHYRMHLALAERATRPRRPVVILTMGASGSGKTWLTTRLCSALPAIRIRSDIERKRLHGIDAAQHSGADVEQGIYSTAATREVYEYLRDRTRDLLAANLDVIVDATFLKSAQRELFVDLTRDAGCALIILECHADEAVLRDRVLQRERDGVDASEANRAVLEYQQTLAEPLSSAEQALTIFIDTSQNADPLRVAGDIWRKLGREIID
ncbi:MAG: AAA family ATPase [Gammaproteobacteria bacterium]|nr:AAA family ATPase [Gammaproteobacteria bacterium]MDH3768628.1 AAA family ATPase [Gammaproteobacteria bacterium]